jgi:predicted RNA-binding protein with PIN domain
MNDEHIMIDGYNAIFRIPALRDLANEDLERARAELVRRIAEAFRDRRERVTIVFDGNREVVAGRGSRSGGVRVVFSRPPQTADQEIQNLVEAAQGTASGKRRLNLRIVSSDREVAERARLWGAKAMSVENFLHDMGGAGREGRSVEFGRSSEGAGPRRKRSGGVDNPESEDKPHLPGGGEVKDWERLFRRPRPGQDAEIDDE